MRPLNPRDLNREAQWEERLAEVERRTRQVDSRPSPARRGPGPKRFARIRWTRDATSGDDRSEALLYAEEAASGTPLDTVWMDYASSCRPPAFGDVVYLVELDEKGVDRGGTERDLYRAVRPIDTTVGIVPATGVVRATSGPRLVELTAPVTGLDGLHHVPLWVSETKTTSGGVAPWIYQDVNAGTYGDGETIDIAPPLEESPTHTGDDEATQVRAPLMYTALGELVATPGWPKIVGSFRSQWNAAFLRRWPIQAIDPVARQVLAFNPNDSAVPADQRYEPSDVDDLLGETGVTPGEYGSGTHYPKFTVDDKGRITAASEVALPGGGGGPIALDDLTDVTLGEDEAEEESKELEAGDFLRLVGEVWRNISLGDIAYDPDEDRIVLTDTTLGLKNRFLLDFSATLEWIYTGDEALATDKWAVMRKIADGVGLYDNGVSVADWNCHPTTAGSRSWRWKIPVRFDELASLRKGGVVANGTALRFRPSGETDDSGTATIHSPAEGLLAIGCILDVTNGLRADASTGQTVTATLAKLTSGGSDGSLIFKNGILVQYIAPD